MLSDVGEAWVEVKALCEGAPILGRHLLLVAHGKVFKAIHDLRLQKKLNISAISSHLTLTLPLETYFSEKFFEVVSFRVAVQHVHEDLDHK